MHRGDDLYPLLFPSKNSILMRKVVKFMLTSILGSSAAAEYQIIRFANEFAGHRDDILDLYIEKSIEYNVQVDFAYLMCLLYTDFFRKPIVNNNLVGIGTQCDGKGLEAFNTLEDCISAQCELLRKGSDITFTSVVPKSTTYHRFPSGSVQTRESAFHIWGYDECTEYTFDDMNEFALRIQMTKRKSDEWVDGIKYYYYILIASSTMRSKVMKKKSELVNKGFSADNFRVYSKEGLFFLELGKYSDIQNVRILLNNIRLYGYDGEIKFRRIVPLEMDI